MLQAPWERLHPATSSGGAPCIPRPSSVLTALAFLLVLFPFFARPAHAGPREKKTLPPVVLVVLDALRPDRLGVYGNRERPTSPNLDRFAEEAVVFERAYAPAPYTLASVASLLTGVAPDAHTLTDFGRRLPPSIPTVPGHLSNAGYRTLIASRSGVLRGFGIEEGFHVQVLDPSLAEDEKGFRRAWKKSLRELVDCGSPWFAYLHFLPPHAPYRTPQGFPLPFPIPSVPAVGGSVAFLKSLDEGKTILDERGRAAVLARYDANVVYADHLFGDVLDFLREAGVFDRCFILVASDHGEAFGEHGRWEHNSTVYEEMIRIPLIVRPPGGRSGTARIRTPVTLLGVLPTLLDWASLDRPSSLFGLPLPLDPMRPAPERLVSMSARSTGPSVRFSVYDGGWKYIRSLDGQQAEELYDLSADPAERKNLAKDRADLLTTLGEKASALIDAQRRSAPRAVPRAPLDPTVEQNIRALGYVQ